MRTLTGTIRRLAMFVCFGVALLPAAAPAQNAESLAGAWQGTFRYASSSGQRDVPFRLEINVRGTSVSGRTSEPNTFGDANAQNLFGNVVGIVDGRRLRLVKTYDGTGGQSHSVYYEGTLDGSARSIEGTWTISDRWSGSFRLSR